MNLAFSSLVGFFLAALGHAAEPVKSDWSRPVSAARGGSAVRAQKGSEVPGFLRVGAAAAVEKKRRKKRGKKRRKGKRGKKKGKRGTPTPRTRTYYEADLGDNGFFVMTLADTGAVTYLTNLKNLDQGGLADTIGSSLGYHLHSGVVGPQGDATEGCGSAFTAGHYDPTLMCGGATTAPLCSDVGSGVACCEERPAPGYCSPEAASLDTCEVGDLSGLHGAIPVAGGTAQHFVSDGKCPECDVHYDPTATAQDGSARFDTWASVVFHGIDGQRVLCADLVEVEAADLGRVAGGFVIEEVLSAIGTK